MGQDFVKNFPDNVDSLEDIDVTSRMFNFDSPNKTESKEAVHSFATSRSTLSASSERLLMQDAPKIQCINQTFSTSSNKNLTIQQGHRINNRTKSDTLQRESLRFMKGVMDECTHVANFSGMYLFVSMWSWENWIRILCKERYSLIGQSCRQFRWKAFWVLFCKNLFNTQFPGSWFVSWRPTYHKVSRKCAFLYLCTFFLCHAMAIFRYEIHVI